MVAEDVLAFAGVAPPTLRLYPIETHIAEKLHAYTMPRARPNSRVKDLPDLALCDDEGVDLIQEALAYRLPWAMEAVRVHAQAVEHEAVDTLTGLAALAVEAGSSKLSVITLVRAGLSSREAAAAAVQDTAATFTDSDGMREWLNSELVEEPTVGTYGGVMTPDLQPLGLMLRGNLRQPRKSIVSAQVAAGGAVEIEFFGPRGMR